MVKANIFRRWHMGLILIAIVAYFLIKHFDENNAGSNNSRGRKDPIDILDERYAKGEIDDEEYSRRRKTLED